MTSPKDEQEITVEVRSSKPDSKPTDQDVERAIHQKFETEPTELFVRGNTVILKVFNFGG